MIAVRLTSFHLWCTIVTTALGAATLGACAADPDPGHLVGAPAAKSAKPSADAGARSTEDDGGGGGNGNAGGNGGGNGNAGGNGDGNGGGNGGGGDDAGASACVSAVASPGDGQHHPGDDCLGCHAGMSGASWTIAGTLFSSAAGGGGVSGATIVVVDANGSTIDLATNDNGNFYTDQDVAFPITVRASQCPADSPMNSTPQNGSCNTGGCHASGNRIHL